MTNGCRRNLKLYARFDNILTGEKMMCIYERKNEDKSALITETIILGNSSNNGKQISSRQLAGDTKAAVKHLKISRVLILRET